MSFWERMERVINQGIEASKEVFDKAREKAKEMGEKGILKFEIMQLEKDAEREFIKLGTTVFELLEEKDNVTLPGDSAEIRECCKKVHDIKEEILAKEDTLKKL